MIRVMVADDHAMMRAGVRRIIDAEPDMRVTAEAVDGGDVLKQIEGLACDVVMLDLTMPGVNGTELIRALKQARPRLPVLVLSMHNVGRIAAAALRAGASGYLTKDSDPERLIEVIRIVAAGGRHVDPAVASKIVLEGAAEQAPHESLSPREREIFQLIVGGMSTGEIAARLHLSAKTVSTHKKNILEKMQLDSTAELVRYAVQHQL
ncbi:response regulator [Noviherbaspirillum aridicola]|uniref:DNA-binding response regulator n=1 Tax=Noviherbaspirillum aridicola TaxID=2849687 RepID=A0ABQ4Q6L9_9BURK|nr:response regulator transcription factor [Noviherbaspirillum aridicola]GIZ52830.1 DNA-binding response regulator [Noviherbaspirillum aridicola]